jgi:hypothetical protein
MKAPHSCSTSRHAVNGTQPYHMGRSKDATWQGREVYSRCSTWGSDPLRGTPDPYAYKSRAPKKTQRAPWEYPSPPPGEVRALARSRGEKDPAMSRGPVLARVQAFPALPTITAWLEARDVSRRAEPDVKPMKSCSLCIYYGEDTPPVTTLTGGVPSQHLKCPVQSAGRRRQSHPAGGVPDQSVGKQCARAERRTVLITPSTRSFPCTPRIRRSRMSGPKESAPAAHICGSKYNIRYVPGPTCRGSVPLCMPPFGYKRGGMRRYKTDPILGRHSQVHTSSRAIHHTVE